jgi:hypothetical protein
MPLEPVPTAEKSSWLKTGPSAGASGTVAIAMKPNLAHQIPAGSPTYAAVKSYRRDSRG